MWNRFGWCSVKCFQISIEYNCTAAVPVTAPLQVQFRNFNNVSIDAIPWHNWRELKQPNESKVTHFPSSLIWLLRWIEPFLIRVPIFSSVRSQIECLGWSKVFRRSERKENPKRNKNELRKSSVSEIGISSIKNPSIANHLLTFLFFVLRTLPRLFPSPSLYRDERVPRCDSTFWKSQKKNTN